MALSEQEQRLLEEMERNLYKNEADIVQTSVGPRCTDYTKVAIGLLLLVAGLGAIVAAVATRIPLIGVAGFALALAGVLVAIAANKPVEIDPQAEPSASQRESDVRKKSTSSSKSFFDRLGEEWDKRQG
ncbi:DUF3040 domain-containing protein [Humidisolicoccus flavus]|uniref:DUF3040 domain-containing protein n=1 Tax=Humidisolicoccus flavus TaxID=3111414 RepID=UPI00324EA0DC